MLFKKKIGYVCLSIIYNTSRVLETRTGFTGNKSKTSQIDMTDFSDTLYIEISKVHILWVIKKYLSIKSTEKEERHKYNLEGRIINGNAALHGSVGTKY